MPIIVLTLSMNCFIDYEILMSWYLKCEIQWHNVYKGRYKFKGDSSYTILVEDIDSLNIVNLWN